MAVPGDVWQRMNDAVQAMCGQLSFEQRLTQARISLAPLLGDHAEFDDDENLVYVLNWLKSDVDRKQPLNEIEASKLVTAW
jgi:hypothetical protein